MINTAVTLLGKETSALKGFLVTYPEGMTALTGSCIVLVRVLLGIRFFIRGMSASVGSQSFIININQTRMRVAKIAGLPMMQHANPPRGMSAFAGSPA